MRVHSWITSLISASLSSQDVIIVQVQGAADIVRHAMQHTDAFRAALEDPTACIRTWKI